MWGNKKKGFLFLPSFVNCLLCSKRIQCCFSQITFASIQYNCHVKVIVLLWRLVNINKMHFQNKMTWNSFYFLISPRKYGFPSKVLFSFFFFLFNFSVSPFPIQEHSYILTAVFEALTGSEAISHGHFGRKPQGSGQRRSSAPSPERVSDLGGVTHCEVPRNGKSVGYLIVTFYITWLLFLELLSGTLY